MTSVKSNSLNSNDDIFFTETMARILEDQGYLDDALMIYTILSTSNPKKESLNENIQRLKTYAKNKVRS